jgi:hypothetical protein
VVRLCLFPFSLLGKAKQWFYSNKATVSTWVKQWFYSTKFFLLGKTNALWNKISTFQQLTDETITEAWECLQDYISSCPHHGMEDVHHPKLLSWASTNNVFCLNQGFNSGGNKPVSRSTTTNWLVMGKILTEMSPNSGISSEIS